MSKNTTTGTSRPTTPVAVRIYEHAKLRDISVYISHGGKHLTDGGDREPDASKKSVSGASADFTKYLFTNVADA